MRRTSQLNSGRTSKTSQLRLLFAADAVLAAVVGALTTEAPPTAETVTAPVAPVTPCAARSSSYMRRGEMQPSASQGEILQLKLAPYMPSEAAGFWPPEAARAGCAAAPPWLAPRFANAAKRRSASVSPPGMSANEVPVVLASGFGSGGTPSCSSVGRSPTSGHASGRRRIAGGAGSAARTGVPATAARKAP